MLLISTGMLSHALLVLYRFQFSFDVSFRYMFLRSIPHEVDRVGAVITVNRRGGNVPLGYRLQSGRYYGKVNTRFCAVRHSGWTAIIDNVYMKIIYY